MNFQRAFTLGLTWALALIALPSIASSPEAERPIEYLAWTRSDLRAALEGGSMWANLAELRAQAELSEGRITATLDDPTISWSVARHIQGSDFVDGSQHALSVSWEVPLRRIRATRSAIASIRSEHARALSIAESRELQQTLWQSWHATYVMQQHISVIETTIASLEVFRDTLSRRIQLGVDSPYEIRRLDLWIEGQKDEMEALQSALNHEAHFIARALGLPSTQMIVAEIPGSPLPTSSLAVAFDVDVDLASARVAHELAVELRRLAAMENTPTLVLEGGAQIAKQSFGTAALGGVGVRLPVSQRNRRNLAAADAQVELARAEENWIKELTSFEYQRSKQRAERLAAAIKRIEEILLPRALESLDAAKLAFANDLIGFAEMLDAFATVQGLEERRLQVLYDAANAAAELERWAR